MPLIIRRHVAYPPRSPDVNVSRSTRGLVRGARAWTERDEAMVLEHYGRMDIDELAARLRRTRIAVQERARQIRHRVPA